MPVLIWVIVGIVAFNVLFVAVRLWATQPREHRGARSLAPIYATVPRRRR